MEWGIRISFFALGVIVAWTFWAGGAHADLRFWQEKRAGYICQGTTDTVICKERHYQISLVPGIVNVGYNGKVVFWCKRIQPPKPNCSYVR